MKQTTGQNDSIYRTVQNPELENALQKYQIPEHFRRLGTVLELGKGSVGTVWRITGKEDYALKEIYCRDNPKVRQQTLHEIDVMARLKGEPGVIQLIDYDVEDSDAVYLLEPYVRPFPERIRDEDFTAEAAIRSVMDICEALAACAGRGILHLDVQPKNLFVEPSGRTVLGDFSVSLFEDEAQTLRESRGTLAYMAPEVYRDRLNSHRSDIYSLGMVLFGLFNNMMLPFMEDASDETAIYKRLAGTTLPKPSWTARSGIKSNLLTDVIVKMCAFRPEDRYSDALACRDALERILPEVALSTEPLFSAQSQSEEPEFFDADTFETSMAIMDEHWDNPEKGMGNPPQDLFTFDADSMATTAAIPWNGNWNDSEEKSDILPRPSITFDADRLATSMVSAPDVESNDPFHYESASRPRPVANSAPAPFECRVCGQHLQPGAIFCHLCGSRVQPPQAPITISRVQFSAVAPKKLIKGEYNIINVVMYEDAFRHIVDEIISEADAPVTNRKSGVLEARLGARVMIRLTSPDLAIDDCEEEGEWVGEYLEFDFAVLMPNNYTKRQVLFVAEVYIDGFIATQLKFTALCFSMQEQKMQIRRDDVLSAFVSYASADREKVIPILQGLQKARPDMDVFFDVDYLRSGQEWENTLYREIERRDILYLCWSRNAQKSEWVKREWEYAYQIKGIEGIEPIPIEPPEECPPPAELSCKHFNDRLIYILKALKTMSGKSNVPPLSEE